MEEMKEGVNVITFNLGRIEETGQYTFKKRTASKDSLADHILPAPRKAGSAQFYFGSLDRKKCQEIFEEESKQHPRLRLIVIRQNNCKTNHGAFPDVTFIHFDSHKGEVIVNTVSTGEPNVYSGQATSNEVKRVIQEKFDTLPAPKAKKFDESEDEEEEKSKKRKQSSAGFFESKKAAVNSLKEFNFMSKENLAIYTAGVKEENIKKYKDYYQIEKIKVYPDKFVGDAADLRKMIELTKKVINTYIEENKDHLKPAEIAALRLINVKGLPEDQEKYAKALIEGILDDDDDDDKSSKFSMNIKQQDDPKSDDAASKKYKTFKKM